MEYSLFCMLELNQTPVLENNHELPAANQPEKFKCPLRFNCGKITLSRA